MNNMNDESKGSARSVRRAIRKGFTLLELMIVMAIIGILTAVLVPTIISYITRSRLNTANANAKVIFNSLQTIVQEYEFNERPLDSSLFYGSPKTMGQVFIACDQGSITNISSTSNPSLDKTDSAISSADANSLSTKMARLFADYQETSWLALVDGYTVRVVYAATSNTIDYIGCYPGQATKERGELGTGLAYIDADDLRAKGSLLWGISL